MERIWQRKGLGTQLLPKLAEVARQQDFKILKACVIAQNSGMKHLFRKLPYEIKTRLEDDMLALAAVSIRLPDRSSSTRFHFSLPAGPGSTKSINISNRLGECLLDNSTGTRYLNFKHYLPGDHQANPVTLSRSLNRPVP